MKNNKIVIYKTPKGKEALDVKLEKETVWLSQKQMSLLFKKNKKTISEHIRNVFKEGELKENSVVRKFQITASDGKKYSVNHYNLDVIISVGYRVKSQRGVDFRIWATSVLRDHIVKGYTINQKRLKENENLKLGELERAIKLFKKAQNNKLLNESEAKGLLKIITDYANSWILLEKYDKGKLKKKKKKTKKGQIFDYEETKFVIEKFKKNLIRKKQASNIFGRERDDDFEAILGNIKQSFSGKELYPNIESKAAHLLYFVIKDHPFTDGNKRIASLLFILFLKRNGYLFNKKGEKKINDNTLVALALLIAQSDPKEKEVMIALITNLL